MKPPKPHKKYVDADLSFSICKSHLVVTIIISSIILVVLFRETLNGKFGEGEE